MLAIVDPTKSANRVAEKGPSKAFFGSAGINANQRNTRSDSSELRTKRKIGSQPFFILLF
jgi:hypothetical protein